MLAGLGWLFACAPHASAQEPTSSPTIAAARIPSAAAVRLDGILDEPIWLTAGAANGFRQREPDNGLPATERTDVRVLYDDNRLIVASKG